MKTPRSLASTKLWMGLATFALTFAFPLTSSAQDQTINGNLTVTGSIEAAGSIDSGANTLTFGTQGSAFGGALLHQDNSTDTFTFFSNRNPASWLWQHTVGIAAMRLDANHQLILYQSNGTTAGITLTPASNQLSLGTATLTASGTAISTNGALTVAGNLTNSSTSAVTSFMGNVGIGTASPGAKLDVFGGDVKTRFGAWSADNTGIQIGAEATERPRIGFHVSDNSRRFKIEVNSINTANERLGFFATAGGALPETEFLTLNKGGNVGIGTTAPAGKLHLHQSGPMDGLYLSRSGHDTIMLGLAGANYTRFHNVTDNRDDLVLDFSGNVGIGTTAPSTKLDVEGNVRVGSGALASWGDVYLSTNSGWGTNAYPTIGSVGGTTGSLIMLHNPHVPFRTDNAAPGNSGRAGIRAAINASASTWWDFGLAGDFFHVYRNGTGEFLRVTNTGNVGIGTNSPTNSLDVRGTGARFDGWFNENTTNTGIYFGRNPMDNTPRALFANGNAAQNWQIDNNAGTFRWYLPGVEHMLLRSSGLILPNGSLGIGTSTPATRLHVNGAGDQEISVSSTDTNARRWTVQSSGAGTNVGKFQIVDRTAVASRLAIDATGNVGIGTVTPAAKLDVAGEVMATGLVEKKVSFVPNTAGWWRVVQHGAEFAAGTIRIHAQNQINGQYVENEIQFSIPGYGGTGALLQTRGSAYTGGQDPLISAARISNNNGSTVYLDLYVRQAATSPIVLYGFGPRMPAFVTPTANATAGYGEMQIALSSGFITDTVKLTGKAASGQTFGHLLFGNWDTSSYQYSAQIRGVSYGNPGSGWAPGGLSFYTGYNNGPTERVRINDAGNVGIGTTTPTEKLEVAGNLKVTGTFSATNYTTTSGTITGGNSGLAFSAGGTNQNITLSPSGVGGVSVNSNDLTLVGTSPTVTFKDPDGRTGYWHVNSNKMYLLSAPQGAGYGAWAQVNSRWPLEFDLNSNFASFGGNASFGSSVLVNDAIVNASSYTDNTAFHGSVVSNSGVGALLDVSNGGIWAQDLLVLRRMVNGGTAPAVGLGASVAFTLDAGSAASHAPETSARISSVLTATNGTNNSSALTFSTATLGSLSEKLRIDHSGNVGIGTTNPTAKLTIEDSSVYGPLFVANDSNTYLAFGSWKGSGGHDYRIGIDGSTLWFGAWEGYRWYRTSNGAIDMVLKNGDLGIGTTSPVAKLDVNGNLKIGDGSRAELQGPDRNHMIVLRGKNDGAVVDQISYYEYGDHVFYTGGLVGGQTEKLRITSGGNVGIGTTTPTHKLAVNGTIRAKEVIVDTGWADYVFEEDYRLAPLAEVETHIKAKKHLPGIPSAAEVAEHGVSMGEMQSKLLAKVEELTLHMIEQNKRSSAQQKLLDEQQTEIAALRAELSQMKGRHP